MSDVFVSSGVTSSGVTVSGAIRLQILSGGTAVDTSIINNGEVEIHPGGRTFNTTASEASSEAIMQGGSAFGTVLYGSQQDVQGTATDTVANDSYITVFHGTLIGATLNGASSLNVYPSGTASATTINSGASDGIYGGGSASGTVVNFGGTQILSGGASSATTVNPGGVELVSAGAASGTTLLAGGVQFVQGDGYDPDAAVGTVADAGAVQYLLSGATTTGTLLSGGSETIYDGGRASATVVSSGGGLAVTSGGTAQAAVVSSGGNQVVYSGGAASNTTVIDGGLAVVSAGGVEIADAGASTGVTLLGGRAIVSSGAEAIGTRVDASPLDGNPGWLFVRSGGVVEDTAISAGLMSVDAGGLASNTTMAGGINLNDDGEVDGVVATGGSQVFLENNARGSGITVSDFANDQVYRSAVTVGTTVNGTGYEVVSGGAALGTVVNSGGSQQVYGGLTANTVINQDGAATLFSSAFAAGTIIDGGGREYLSAGAVTDATVVNSGGFEYVSAGGTATGTTVNAGGTEIVAAGGEASGTQLMPGATIDLPDFSYGFSVSAILDPATDVLTLSSPFQSYTQQLSGSYTGDSFSVAPASGGLTGTLLTLISPPLTAALPDPLHTGVQTVTGTGGIPGLQLERITQGTYNAPGQAGWVKAAVNADGSWSAALTFSKPGRLAHVYAANGGSTTVVDLVDGTPVAPSPPPSSLKAMLPDPLYTGPETVTGTGGVAGLRLERITQGTYNTPGAAGWVEATVAADGSWSASLRFDKPGMLAHVYAQNGGSGAVTDLVDGLPSDPPATAGLLQKAVEGVSGAIASDMTAQAGGAAPKDVAAHAGEVAFGSILHVPGSGPEAVMLPDHAATLLTSSGSV